MSDERASASASNAKHVMPESSMEEIIASISRLIAKDNHRQHPSRVAASENREILELTDAIEADGTIRQLSGGDRAKDAGSQAEGQSRVAADDKTDVQAKAGAVPEALLSSAAAEAAVAAFDALGIGAANQAAHSPSLHGSAGCNLEAIVREAVRPLLRAWLNDHFPAIIERLVREEVQRLISEVRPR